ncbi:hypothetical protein JL720_9691 [Aureococcus anophagefferens]|nr:hypothetical protein JL720_9691 [Aureococcus anophagefferens]
MPASCVTIQVGQCGNQLGAKLLDRLARDFADEAEADYFFRAPADAKHPTASRGAAARRRAPGRVGDDDSTPRERAKRRAAPPPEVRVATLAHVLSLRGGDAAGGDAADAADRGRRRDLGDAGIFSHLKGRDLSADEVAALAAGRFAFINVWRSIDADRPWPGTRSRSATNSIDDDDKFYELRFRTARARTTA